MYLELIKRDIKVQLIYLYDIIFQREIKDLFDKFNI